MFMDSKITRLKLSEWSVDYSIRCVIDRKLIQETQLRSRNGYNNAHFILFIRCVLEKIIQFIRTTYIELIIRF